MEIRYLQERELIVMLDEFFNKISITYDLKLPDIKFSAILAKVIKQHFGWLTFDQIEEAFELNSIGSLNEYLPKSGYSIDNKVKFNIPDITKIIKAYAVFKKIARAEVKQSNEPSDIEKNKMINDWCDNLCKIFDNYKHNGEKEPIRIPLFYANVLAKIGLISDSQIDKKEKIINLRTYRHQDTSNNENLVYHVFDELIYNKDHINNHLHKYRQSYLNGVCFDEENKMPY